MNKDDDDDDDDGGGKGLREIALSYRLIRDYSLSSVSCQVLNTIWLSLLIILPKFKRLYDVQNMSMPRLSMQENSGFFREL